MKDKEDTAASTEVEPIVYVNFMVTKERLDAIVKACTKYLDPKYKYSITHTSHNLLINIKQDIQGNTRQLIAINDNGTACCGERILTALYISPSGRDYINGDYKRLNDLVSFIGLAAEQTLLSSRIRLLTISSSMVESPLLELLVAIRGYTKAVSFQNVRTSHICNIYHKRLDDNIHYDVDKSNLEHDLSYYVGTIE